MRLRGAGRREEGGTRGCGAWRALLVPRYALTSWLPAALSPCGSPSCPLARGRIDPDALLPEVVAVIARNDPVGVAGYVQVLQRLVDLRVRVVGRHEALAAQPRQGVNDAGLGGGQRRLACYALVKQGRRPVVIGSARRHHPRAGVLGPVWRRGRIVRPVRC